MSSALDFDALFREHFDDVHRMVSRLSGPLATQEDIEDACQQVFIAAHRALPRFRGDAKITTWLWGIATRVVLTQRRSFRRRARLQEALYETREVVVGPATSVEKASMHKQELERVWRCVTDLRPKLRAVYLMFEIEGLSGTEIATALGVPEATVWTRLRLARHKLTLKLARSEPE